MDGLVKDGTITIAQEVAIQSVITKAKEDGTINTGSRNLQESIVFRYRQ